MQRTDGQKVCFECGEFISPHLLTCPYCGVTHNHVNQVTQNGQEVSQGMKKDPLFRQQSLEDSLSSLYAPPYQKKIPSFEIQERPSPESASFSPSSDPIPSLKEPFSSSSEDMSETPLPSSSFWHTVKEMACLMGGVNLLILGLMQLFFGRQGLLRLEWKTDKWPFYLGAAFFLFFWGLKKTKRKGEGKSLF